MRAITVSSTPRSAPPSTFVARHRRRSENRTRQYRQAHSSAGLAGSRLTDGQGRRAWAARAPLRATPPHSRGQGTSTPDTEMRTSRSSSTIISLRATPRKTHTSPRWEPDLRSGSAIQMTRPLAWARKQEEPWISSIRRRAKTRPLPPTRSSRRVPHESAPHGRTEAGRKSSRPMTSSTVRRLKPEWI